MANFEAFRWNFSSSTNLKIGRSVYPNCVIKSLCFVCPWFVFELAYIFQYRGEKRLLSKKHVWTLFPKHNFFFKKHLKHTVWFETKMTNTATFSPIFFGGSEESKTSVTQNCDAAQHYELNVEKVHFARTMHSLPQRLKSTFFELCLSGGYQKGTWSEEWISKEHWF